MSIALVLAVVCWFAASRPRQDAQARASAQDAVYEVVVRDAFASMHSKATELVFDENLNTGIDPASGSSPKDACMEAVQQEISRHRYEPILNTIADKAYRLIARGAGDYSIRADTIQDFAKQVCIGGRLPETFHTDLPRTFISPDSIAFDFIEGPDGTKSPEIFKQVYPGASGIISLSRVGFDSRQDEAMVSTSFVCGGLCGDGHVYVLRKKSGRWSVVNAWLEWIS
ncbi:MAG: hypothetical protein KGL02_11000 [Acidobacteriota bacterium]|nr:hypothetical protein [Acidobacteriota bacterium]MDE3171119.1 hypothetical protein [Acidobacteriota bacterium]